MKPHQSIRDKQSSARIDYDPEWCPSRPFKMVMSGEVIGRAATTDSAIQTMKRRAIRHGWLSELNDWSDWS